MTYHSKPRPKIQHWPKPAGAQIKPKGTPMKKLVITSVAVAALSVPLAPVSQAAPCKFPQSATWCAPRDGSDSNSTRQAGDHLDRPSAKTSAGDGTMPAIRFRIPGYKAPVQKRAAGDGVTAPIRWR